MVSVEFFEHSQPPDTSWVGQIVLRPNNSLSWRAAKLFLAAMFILSFGVALSFTAQGYWMILVFTTIEMSALAAGFWVCLQRNNMQEVIRFSADSLCLERGRHRPERRFEWSRFFTKVLVKPGKHPWYPQHIALRYKDQEHEIGRFLSTEEKVDLVRAIRHMIERADRRQIEATS